MDMMVPLNTLPLAHWGLKSFYMLNGGFYTLSRFQLSPDADAPISISLIQPLPFSLKYLALCPHRCLRGLQTEFIVYSPALPMPHICTCYIFYLSL